MLQLLSEFWTIADIRFSDTSVTCEYKKLGIWIHIKTELLHSSSIWYIRLQFWSFISGRGGFQGLIPLAFVLTLLLANQHSNQSNKIHNFTLKIHQTSLQPSPMQILRHNSEQGHLKIPILNNTSARCKQGIFISQVFSTICLPETCNASRI